VVVVAQVTVVELAETGVTEVGEAALVEALAEQVLIKVKMLELEAAAIGSTLRVEMVEEIPEAVVVVACTTIVIIRAVMAVQELWLLGICAVWDHLHSAEVRHTQ